MNEHLQFTPDVLKGLFDIITGALVDAGPHGNNPNLKAGLQIHYLELLSKLTDNPAFKKTYGDIAQKIKREVTSKAVVGA